MSIILFGYLLALLYSQPVAAWLRFLNSQETRLSLKDPDHRPGGISNLPETSFSYEGFPSYGDATEMFPEDPEKGFPDSSNHMQHPSKGPEDIRSPSQEVNGTVESLEDPDNSHSSSQGADDTNSSVQDPDETQSSPHHAEDTQEHPEIPEDSHSPPQDAVGCVEDLEGPESKQNPTQDAEEAVDETVDAGKTRRPSEEELDETKGSTGLQEGPEDRSHAFGLFLGQLGPLIFQAFFSSVTTVIFNWFFPFKVVPPPPGLVGISQLWGGLPHPKHWHHHWGHLHQGPGKWGNGNWGHAYWGPAYGGHTPPAPPARPWEPHPHAHL